MFYYVLQFCCSWVNSVCVFTNEQDVTQGHFFKRSLAGLNSDFPSPRLVAMLRLKTPICFSWKKNYWIRKQLHPGIELRLPCPFPIMETFMV